MRRRLSLVGAFALLAGTLVLAPGVLGSHAIVGPNVKVTDDNLNVDGGIGNVTPSKDAQNRQSNETTVAISHLASPVTGVVGDLIAESANDYRMAPWFGDTWMPIYLSFDGGTTWFSAPPFFASRTTSTCRSCLPVAMVQPSPSTAAPASAIPTWASTSGGWRNG